MRGQAHRLLRKAERKTGSLLQVLESAVRGGSQIAEVVLQQEGHTVSATSVASDGIDAIAESRDRLQPAILRLKAEAARDARVPFAGLLETVHVIHDRCCAAG